MSATLRSPRYARASTAAVSGSVTCRVWQPALTSSPILDPNPKLRLHFTKRKEDITMPYKQYKPSFLLFHMNIGFCSRLCEL